MTDEPRPAGVSPPVAVVFATVSFVALSIGGLGVASLLLDADVIPVQGLGAIPGVVGQVLALTFFAGTLWGNLRVESPGYLGAVTCAVAAYLGEVGGVLVGAVVTGIDPAQGLAAAGMVAVGFAGPVVAAAALLAALLGVFLVRARTSGPRWRWENDDDGP